MPIPSYHAGKRARWTRSLPQTSKVRACLAMHGCTCNIVHALACMHFYCTRPQVRKEAVSLLLKLTSKPGSLGIWHRHMHVGRTARRAAMKATALLLLRAPPRRENTQAATPNDVPHLAPMASLYEDVSCLASTATASTPAPEAIGRVVFSGRSSKEARSPLELALAGANAWKAKAHLWQEGDARLPEVSWTPRLMYEERTCSSPPCSSITSSCNSRPLTAMSAVHWIKSKRHAELEERLSDGTHRRLALTQRQSSHHLRQGGRGRDTHIYTGGFDGCTRVP
jgi:hypothetical protein